MEQDNCNYIFDTNFNRNGRIKPNEDLLQYLKRFEEDEETKDELKKKESKEQESEKESEKEEKNSDCNYTFDTNFNRNGRIKPNEDLLQYLKRFEEDESIDEMKEKKQSKRKISNTKTNNIKIPKVF